MNPEEDYIKINRDTWNRKTEIHIKSEFYDMVGFISGKSSLNQIELDLLGDVSRKSILHLQCHFGQDSISLSRLGAEVTGVDLSDTAIENAIDIAKKCGTKTKFICCDIYDLHQHLGQQFDIVFASYGVIGWLPDLDKWAKLIASFLKPGGKLVFVEFHPVVWMFDDDFEKVAYDYFKSDAIVETESGTYADRDAPIIQQSVSWNHSMSETLNALIDNSLEILSMDEYDYSPYNCFKHTEEYEPGKFRIVHMGNKIPMVYSVLASKKFPHLSESYDI
jgi:SAM-dependent methyltransferase